MLENIRQIGLFMIAAQAVIHFAPAKHYEKYIKLISSVIILLLFIRPFIAMRGGLEEEWRTGLEQIIQKYEEESVWQENGQSSDVIALEHLEGEIKSRLNDAISEGEYYVREVSLVFEKDLPEGGKEIYELQLQSIKIVMSKGNGTKMEPILVEDIVIGDETQREYGEEELRYQDIFAGILGIEPGRVEVICVGGW